MSFPTDNLSPGAFTKVDSSGAGGGADASAHFVLIGRMATGATASPNVLQPLGSPAQARELYGLRSPIAAMHEAIQSTNDGPRVSAIGIDGGTAAVGELAFTGAATEDGTMTVRVGDQRFPLSVASGATAAVVAGAVAATLTADTRLPVTAEATAGDVTLTAAFGGPTAHDIELEVSGVPAGLTATVTAMAGGGTEAALTDAIAALMPDGRYTFVSQLNDSVSLAALVAELNARWDTQRAVGGHLFFGRRGSWTDVMAYADGRNAAAESVVATEGSASPHWLWAAALAGAALVPSRPNAARFGVPMRGVEAPTPRNQPSHGQRNQMLRAGLSTYRVVGGEPVVDRIVTTYTQNAAGEADRAWQDFTTRLTIDFLRRDWNARAAKNLGAALADDGTSVDASVRLVTPQELRAEAVGWAKEKERAGLIERLEEFRRRLRVELENGDPNAVVALLTPDIVNKLITIKTTLRFAL